MNPEPDRQVTVRLRFAAVAAPGGVLSPLPCLLCREPLEFHQPDADDPDRMLATCESCRAWHLVDCAPDAPEWTLVLLPDAASLRAPRPG